MDDDLVGNAHAGIEVDSETPGLRLREHVNLDPLIKLARTVAFAAPVTLAYLAIIAWTIVELPRACRRDRRDALLFVAVVSLALALRLAVPWGPLDFAETSRLGDIWVWGAGITPSRATVTALYAALRALGVPLAALLRAGAPLVGALGVGLLVPLARGAGLSRGAACLAAGIALFFPPLVRYAGSPLAIFGPTAVTGAYAAALATGQAPRWRAALVGAGVVLAGCTRTELLVVAPLALLLLAGGSGFRRRDLIVPALLVGAALTALWIDYHRGEGQPFRRDTMLSIRPFLLDTTLAPSWFLLAGAAGLVLGPLPARARVALVGTVLLALLIYGALGSEYNRLFGEWRYHLILVPMLAVGAGALVDRLAAPRRRPVLAVLLALCPASLLIHRGPLFRRLNLQSDFTYVVESAPRIAAAYSALVILAQEDFHPGDVKPYAINNEHFESVAQMALSAALERRIWLNGCRQPPVPQARVFVAGALADGCQAHADPAHAAIYLGEFRPESLLARLRAAGRLVPIEERVITVAPEVPHFDTQCPNNFSPFCGDLLPDCRERFGWYRLEPAR